MSRMIEQSAATVDEAIRQALESLHSTADEAVIEVLDEGEAGGLLGFGRRPALVRVTVEGEEPEAAEDDVDFAASFMDYEPDPADSEEAAPQERGRQRRRKREPRREPQRRQPRVENIEVVELTDEQKEAGESFALDFLAEILSSLEAHGKMSSYYDEYNILRIDIDGEEVGQVIGRRGETLEAISYLLSLAVRRQVAAQFRVVLDVAHYRDRNHRKIQQQAQRLAEKVLRTRRRYVMAPMTPAERRQVHMVLADYDGLTTYSEGEEPNRRVVIAPDDQR